MIGEFRRRPLLLKGALVTYDQPILGPVPNIIVFQYNPEQLTRTLQPRLAHPQPKGTTAARNDAVLTAGFPSESISLAIELDATDQLELRDPIAMSVGVQPALAALELLMYPKSKDVRLNEQEAGKGKASLKREDTPVVLFYWSEARVVPVLRPGPEPDPGSRRPRPPGVVLHRPAQAQPGQEPLQRNAGRARAPGRDEHHQQASHLGDRPCSFRAAATRPCRRTSWRRRTAPSGTS
jgi:hypothetical protein